MRVLLVTQYFWPESFRINELVDALHKEGAEITVLTGQPNYPEGKLFKGYRIFSIKTEMYNGCQVIRVPIVPRGKAGAFRLIVNYLSFMISASLFGPWMLRKKKIDCIFVYAISPILAVMPAIVLRKLKKTPLVIWIGDLWPQSLVSTGFIKNSILLKIIERLVRFIYRRCDLLLVQSRSFMEPVKKLCGKVAVEYFPNPGESVFLNKNSSVEPVFLLRKGFNVVFAGNLGSVQAIDMIFEAAVFLQDQKEVVIYLFGNGSMTEWLKNEIAKKKLQNLILAGRFESSAMPGIFVQADALLVSLMKDDTMSLTVPAKVQSYMAAGRPIIAALEGEGAKLVTEAGAGLYSPAGDARALADTILQLRNMSRVELDNMGKAGHTYYKENFDAATLSRRLIEKFQWLKDAG